MPAPFLRTITRALSTKTPKLPKQAPFDRDIFPSEPTPGEVRYAQVKKELAEEEARRNPENAESNEPAQDNARHNFQGAPSWEGEPAQNYQEMFGGAKKQEPAPRNWDAEENRGEEKEDKEDKAIFHPDAFGLGYLFSSLKCLNPFNTKTRSRSTPMGGLVLARGLSDDKTPGYKPGHMSPFGGRNKGSYLDGRFFQEGTPEKEKTINDLLREELELVKREKAQEVAEKQKEENRKQIDNEVAKMPKSRRELYFVQNIDFNKPNQSFVDAEGERRESAAKKDLDKVIPFSG